MRELIEILAWFCTGGLMASAALRTGSGAWAAFRARPMLFVRMLFAVWVAVPLIAMTVVWAFSFRGETLAAIVLLSISPGIPVLLAAARREGERALADGLVFLGLAALTVPFLLPIWARLLEAVYALPLIARPLELAGILIPTVYVPLGIGLLVHRRWPSFAKKLARFLEIVANVGTVFIALVIIAQGLPVLRTLRPVAVIAAPLLVLGPGLAGWLAARHHPDVRKLFMLAAAMGNPALGLALVATTYPTERAGAIAAAVLVVRGLCLPLLLLEPYLTRPRRSHHPAPSSA